MSLPAVRVAGQPESEPPAAPRSGRDWLLAGTAVPAASLVLLLFEPRLAHWFLVPVTACGVLIAPDAAGWLRRRFDVFDPRALLGLLGLHFFYLAPILHVVLDYWPPRIPPPADWREALGAMATLNLVGLGIYRWLVAPARSAREQPPAEPTASAAAQPAPAPAAWPTPAPAARPGTAAEAGSGAGVALPSDRPAAEAGSGAGAALPSDRPAAGRVTLNEGRFYRIGLLAVAVSLCAFCAEVALFGGPSGFLNVMVENRVELVGMSWLVIPAESFPLIVFALLVVRWRARLARRPVLVVPLIVALALVQFAVGGLRGSRSSTIWPVLLALILVHLLVVAITRKVLLVCAVIAMLFMYSYGLYKAGGTQVLDVARGTRSAEEISARTGRDMLPTILLADFGRADIQALVLDRKRQGYGELGYGVTYLGTSALLLPRGLRPEDPPSKLTIGSEVLYGPGFYDPQARRWSQRVYGLTGEAMLNFGAPGAVLAFIPLGLIVRRSRRFYLYARGEGSSLAAKLLAPSLCIGTVLVLTSDLDNLVFFTVQRLVPLALVVLLALNVEVPSRSGRRPTAASEPPGASGLSSGPAGGPPGRTARSSSWPAPPTVPAPPPPRARRPPGSHRARPERARE